MAADESGNPGPDVLRWASAPSPELYLKLQQRLAKSEGKTLPPASARRERDSSVSSVCSTQSFRGPPPPAGGPISARRRGHSKDADVRSKFRAAAVRRSGKLQVATPFAPYTYVGEEDGEQEQAEEAEDDDAVAAVQQETREEGEEVEEVVVAATRGEKAELGSAKADHLECDLESQSTSSSVAPAAQEKAESGTAREERLATQRLLDGLSARSEEAEATVRELREQLDALRHPQQAAADSPAESETSAAAAAAARAQAEANKWRREAERLKALNDDLVLAAHGALKSLRAHPRSPRQGRVPSKARVEAKVEADGIAQLASPPTEEEAQGEAGA